MNPRFGRVRVRKPRPRNFCWAILDSLRLAWFAQTDPGEFGIGEHAEGNLPARLYLWRRCVIAHDAKIIEGDMRKVRAAGAIAHRPNAGDGGLQTFVDFNVAARSRFDAGQFQADVICVGRPAAGDQEMGALEN